jgi:hypothetical protein
MIISPFVAFHQLCDSYQIFILYILEGQHTSDRSEAGATDFCRIRGYLSTLRKQGMPLLSALQATLCGHPVLPSL